jgi:nucleotide-binding universal stress UspA family protein
MAGTADGIIAGYDGSPGSERALNWAAREARSRGTVLTVCVAWAPGFPVLPAEAAAVADLARRGGERVMADGLRHAQGILGPRSVRALLVEGPPAAVLCERSTGADLVVVGSRGCGGVTSLLLGSVSSQVSAHAHGRVVVVRGHWRHAGSYAPGPVVVGADGSAASTAAVGFAFEEAALRGAAVLVVCALADAPAGLGGAQARRDAFEDAIVRWEKEHSDITVLRQVALGGPRDALLTAAHDAQMLIVGARGRGGVRGMALGSVSRAVLDHAPCPVGVVHRR